MASPTERQSKMPKKTVASNWQELLPDLLTMIANKVGFYEDFVAFRGVCRSWRSVAAKHEFNPSPNQLPWLMLPQQSKKSRRRKEGSDHCKFYNPSGMIRRVELPEARGNHCTESLGWLILTNKNGESWLLHPLTRLRIPLPHLTTLRYYNAYKASQMYIERASLSASPSFTNDYILMVILAPLSRLAYWRPGDKIWNVLGTRGTRYEDVVYHRDHFYAISNQGSVSVFDLRGPNPVAGRDLGVVRGGRLRRAYLVESAGELLAMTRYLGGYWTTRFRVFKFDDLRGEWTQICSLGGRSVFLGYNTALSIDASSSITTIKPDRIYYTDGHMRGYYYSSADPASNDMGVYNVEDGTFEVRYQGDQSRTRHCPSLWVIPSF